MTHTLSVWLVLLAAAVGANLPFVSERLLAVIPWKQPKTLWLRLGELIVCYLLVGALGSSTPRQPPCFSRWHFPALSTATSSSGTDKAAA
jgi:hypothetical protein